MEKQEVKSKWDELARQLGAEISPESERIVEPPAPAAEQSDEPQAATAAPPRPLPRRSSAGWDSLANEFGLAIPEPTPEPPADKLERVAAEPVVESAAEPPARRRVREEKRPTEKAERPRRDRQRREREPSQRRERGGRRHGSRRGERREEPEAVEGEFADAVVDETITDEIEPVELEESTADPAEPRREEPPKPGAAISLWHKIFGAPADQAAKAEETARSRERREEPVAAEESRELAESFTPSSFDPDAEDLDEDDFEKARDEKLTTDDDEDERRRRPRRRRRRRSARGERTDEAPSTDRRRRQPAPVRSQGDDEGEEDLAGDEGMIDAELSAEEERSESPADFDSNGEGSGVSSRTRSALQRSIPSWDQAIGYIVESNMQNRSQRRPSHSASRSSSSRNRPRGRHKR